MTSPTKNLSTPLDKAAAFAQDPKVAEPLAAAIEKSAVDIMAEDATIAGHQLRTNLAISALQNPMALVSRFAWALSTNPGIVDKWVTEQRDAAVNDFQFGVNSVWDAIAGVVK